MTRTTLATEGCLKEEYLTRRRPACAPVIGAEVLFAGALVACVALVPAVAAAADAAAAAAASLPLCEP